MPLLFSCGQILKNWVLSCFCHSKLYRFWAIHATTKHLLLPLSYCQARLHNILLIFFFFFVFVHVKRRNLRGLTLNSLWIDNNAFLGFGQCCFLLKSVCLANCCKISDEAISHIAQGCKNLRELSIISCPQVHF